MVDVEGVRLTEHQRAWLERIRPNIAFFLYFGMKITWYLHSQPL